MNNTLKISITLGMAVLTGLLAYFWLSGVKKDLDSFSVYRASADIIADDTRFSADIVETVSFPEDYRDLMGGAVIEASKANMAALTGRTFTRNIRAGSLLLHEYLETDPEGELSGRLAVGRRALTIPVNASATVGYFVEPGSLVDILGTVIEAPDAAEETYAAPSSMRVSTLTILQAVRVLAVGKALDPSEYRQIGRKGYATVTVDVGPSEAEQLVFAMQQVQGGLTLVLRNPDDADFVETPSVDWESWWAQKRT